MGAGRVVVEVETAVGSSLLVGKVIAEVVAVLQEGQVSGQACYCSSLIVSCKKGINLLLQSDPSSSFRVILAWSATVTQL